MSFSVEQWAIDKVKPYTKNARKIPEAAVDKVAKSLNEYGWRQPIVADKKGVVIVGHTRLLAAQKLGHDTVPVHIAEGLTAAQVRAYRLADNRTHQETDWDMDLLGAELGDLSGLNFDLDLTGFDADEIDALLARKDANDGLTDPDDIPEPPDEPVATLGDVWRLGRHTLVCGDCTEADTVAKCLGDVKPHLMVTDPPYGVEYDATWRARAGVNKNKAKMGAVQNDARADWSEAWALFPGSVAYVWHGGLHAGTVASSLVECGFDVRSQIIWAKDRFALSRGHYHWQHEPCWYVVRGSGEWAGDRKQSTVWNIPARDDSGHGHSTQKPVECMKRPIENNSSPGQAVYEPFSGSGTTIIACEMTGRSCHAIELNPAYIDVAVKRWENFTGLMATRDGEEA